MQIFIIVVYYDFITRINFFRLEFIRHVCRDNFIYCIQVAASLIKNIEYKNIEQSIFAPIVL